MLPPDEYGNILINRTSEQEKVLPVVFSHWTHRLRYTCEVCHTELEFSMKVNTTETSHEEMKDDRHCGACHNGTTAFSHKQDCIKCHNDDNSYIKDKYVYFGKKPFPTTDFGNGIDWTQSLQRGLISPRRYLNEEPSVMDFDRTIELVAEMGNISPAYFSHKSHLDWMGCDMCHPEVFNIKKKGTENFSMTEILKGKFCGGCHLNVAFPIDDCSRCHPKVRSY
jgi:c(7)-type cytochrome triheme protein